MKTLGQLHVFCVAKLVMVVLFDFLAGIKRQESKGTVLFDFKKFMKTIKLIRVVKKNRPS